MLAIGAKSQYNSNIICIFNHRFNAFIFIMICKITDYVIIILFKIDEKGIYYRVS